jgi:hypothetical protein
MSRLGAGIGAGVGGAVGAIAGVAAAGVIDGSAAAASRANDDAFLGGLGMLFGGIVGAAVGAGSSKCAPGTLSGPNLSFKPGDVWFIDFTSDTAVNPQQFFDFVGKFEQSMRMDMFGDVFDVVQIAPIDQTHFRAIVKWRYTGELRELGKSETIDGIKFTITDSGPYASPDQQLQPISPPTSSSGVSAGTVAGAAGAAALLGGVAWLATRKKKRSRRR